MSNAFCHQQFLKITMKRKGVKLSVCCRQCQCQWHKQNISCGKRHEEANAARMKIHDLTRHTHIYKISSILFDDLHSGLKQCVPQTRMVLSPRNASTLAKLPHSVGLLKVGHDADIKDKHNQWKNCSAQTGDEYKYEISYEYVWKGIIRRMRMKLQDDEDDEENLQPALQKTKLLRLLGALPLYSLQMISDQRSSSGSSS